MVAEQQRAGQHAAQDQQQIDVVDQRTKKTSTKITRYCQPSRVSARAASSPLSFRERVGVRAVTASRILRSLHGSNVYRRVGQASISECRPTMTDVMQWWAGLLRDLAPLYPGTGTSSTSRSTSDSTACRCPPCR